MERLDSTNVPTGSGIKRNRRVQRADGGGQCVFVSVCVRVNQMKLPEGKVFKTTKTRGFFTKYAVKLWNSVSLQTKGLHGLKRHLDMFMEKKSTGIYQLHRNPVCGAKAKSCVERWRFRQQLRVTAVNIWENGGHPPFQIHFVGRK